MYWPDVSAYPEYSSFSSCYCSCDNHVPLHGAASIANQRSALAVKWRWRARRKMRTCLERSPTHRVQNIRRWSMLPSLSGRRRRPPMSAKPTLEISIFSRLTFKTRRQRTIQSRGPFPDPPWRPTDYRPPCYSRTPPLISRVHQPRTYNYAGHTYNIPSNALPEILTNYTNNNNLR